jgi:choline-glycine betaine transporter
MKHQEQPRKRNGASTTDASAASSSNAKHKKKSKSKKQFYESDHDDNRGNDDNVQVIMEDLDMVAADEEKEERRRTKAERKRAEKALQKTKEHFAELGLDEDGNLLDHYSLLKYPVRECKFTLPFCGTEPIALNPVVTLIGLSCMWSIVVWSTVDPTGSLQALLAGRSYVALSYTWLFQASKALLCGFLVWIVYKYGHLHLGRNKNEQPEFTMRSWFAILFSSGTGPALLFYSVSETLYHQQSNYYANAGYHVQDEIDLFAVNMTVSNWTITTWLLFTIVAVCTSLAVHCFGLPLSFRSCFYPIFGAYTWGWMGDCIDGLAIVIMMLSTCCMLCLSSIQIVTGLLYMGWVDADSATANDITAMQKATVWIVTFVSTASVISGLHYGIQYMSLLATSLGFVLLFAIFILDDTKYLLNLQTQEVGYFLQNGFFQLNFWTDAFGQLRAGSGRAVDGKSAAEWWISSWIVMYQAWVVALSTVFGVFVARISKGRKLWELVR